MGLGIAFARLARGFSVPVVLLWLAPGIASAQTDQDRRNCFSTGTENYKDPNFYDTGLAGCDLHINSGKYRGKDLSPFVRSRANWLHRKGQLDAALKEYARAIELDPSDVQGYDYRADIFLDQGEYERAIAEYNHAIRIKPDYPAAYYSRGRAYEKLDRIEDAKRSYRQALAIPAKDRTAEWAHREAQRRLDALDR